MLPFLSKIFEKLVCARLDSYLKSNYILCTNQFGFPKNLNTSHVIIEFLDYVYSSLDSKQSTIVVHLDFSKAFITVNHNIYRSKILHDGIRGVMQCWFESYLSNRNQYISIENCSSSISNTTLGVPQGSVLCPVLFLLYINDMYKSSNQMRFVHLADDTKQKVLHPTVTLTMSMPVWIVNRELVGVDNWLKANRLSLNVSKTSYIIISNVKNAINIRIRDSILTKVSTVKFLGVTLDENLTFNQSSAR